MNKADYKFHRDKKEQIQRDSNQTEPALWSFYRPANSPIFIPKRKKKK